MAHQDLAAAAAAPVVAAHLPARAVIDVLDRATGAVLRSLPAAPTTRALALSPDGRRLFEGRGPDVLTWDVTPRGGAAPATRPAGADVLALHASAERLLAFTASGDLVAWSPDGAEVERRALEVEGPVRDVDFAADGGKLLVIDAARVSVFAAQREWKRANALPQGDYRCGALSGTGSRALLGDGAERKLWTLRAAATVHTFRGGEHPVSAAALGRDGRAGLFVIDVSAAGSGGDRKLYLEGYDLEDRKEGLALAPPAGAPRALDSHRLDGLTSTPDGGWLLRDARASTVVWTSPTFAWSVPADAPAAAPHPAPDAWRTLEPADGGPARLGGEDAPLLSKGWPRCGVCDDALTLVAHVPADDARLPLRRAAGVLVFLCLSGKGCAVSDPDAHLVALPRAGRPPRARKRAPAGLAVLEPRAAALVDDRDAPAGRWPHAAPPLQICPDCDEPLRFAFALRGASVGDDLAPALGAAAAVFVCPQEHGGSVATLGA